MMKGIKGQSSVSYILVIAVLAIAIAGMLSSKYMRSSFDRLYTTIASRVMGPHE